MRLRVLLIILASSLSGCLGATAPVKPNVELGVIDYPNGEVIVNMTGGLALSQSTTIRAAAIAIASSGHRVPLASYDRAIAFRPAYWTAVQNYMNAMATYIQNHCNP